MIRNNPGNAQVCPGLQAPMPMGTYIVPALEFTVVQEISCCAYITSVDLGTSPY